MGDPLGSPRVATPFFVFLFRFSATGSVLVYLFIVFFLSMSSLHAFCLTEREKKDAMQKESRGRALAKVGQREKREPGGRGE